MMPLSSQNSVGRSSNLSPLAPPFTLEKPYHKQHNSNKPMNFTEPYGPRFDRPRPAWSPSVNPSYGPNFTENTRKDDNFSPLDVHKFPVSLPNNSSSSSTPLAPLNSVSSTVGYDGFSYGQYSNSAQTTLAEAKPYYSPYVPADDREMLARKEPSYDLLTNFGVAQLSGSSQVGDTETVSGVKYRPQWNGLWNGLNDAEQGNWLDLGGNYSSKDHEHSETSNGQQSMRKGSEAGCDRYNFHMGTLPVGSLESYVETPNKSTNCFGGENSFGSARIRDRKSYKEPNLGATNVTCIRLSAPKSTSSCNEDEMTLDSFLQSPLSSYGLYENPVETRDKCADSYVFDSISKVRSSPNKMTFGGFPSPQYAVSSATTDAVRIEAMDVPEKSPDFLPYHPFGLNNFYAGNTDSLFTGLSSTKLEEKVNNKQVNGGSFDLLSKTKSVSTIPHLSTTDCSTADTVHSMENTAEDSPCWKGARFSPFEDSCFNQSGEEEQKNSPSRFDTTDDTNGLSYLNSSGIVCSPVQIHSEENVIELKKGLYPDAQSSDVFSCSPASNAGDDVLRSPTGKDSKSKVDISVLLNTMKNLSEVLVSHCSNSHDPFTESDHAAFDHIISNLNSCLVKKADQATQTEKSQQDTSCLEPVQTVSKVTSSGTDQHDLDYFGSWKADIDLSDSSSEKDNAETVRDAETVKDAETVQAVKRVLNMTFPRKEMQPETALYKNLWLEAEAALCTTTVKSRFNRMKIEMEKKEIQQTKEEENVAVPKASGVNKVAEQTHEANARQSDMNSSLISRFRTLRSVVEESKPIKPVKCHQSPSSDFEEASVMARFRTLKTRADNTEDQKPPSKDQLEESYLSAMANHIDDSDSAFMSRFNILKARIEQSESPQQVQAGQSNSTGIKNKPLRGNGLGGELLEGWYDCSEPGWEHVTKNKI